MSGYEHFPPPGAPVGEPATPPPPGWAPPSSTTSDRQRPWTPPVGMLGAAHKPGVIPLRPLGLGDLYDASFRVIRFNPQATVGVAVLVAALTMAVPVLVTAVLTFTLGLTIDESSEGVGDTVSSWSTLTSALMLQVSLVFVTACVAHVVSQAAIGRRTTLAATWAATRGRRWRLVGLSLLVLVSFLAIIVGYVVAWVLVVELTDGVVLPLLFGFVSVPAFLALMGWVWIRLLYLPAPVLVLEQVGMLRAIGRGYRLSARQTWRTLGIALLTLLITVVAAQMLAVPFSVAGLLLSDVVDPAHSALVLVVSQALATVAAAAFAGPFTAAVVSLQYVDLRMRKEGYDVELMARAGVLGR
ncbi:hypothetical protein [Nocardioides lijunqiniae]|uniref:hypothetical protein n=1 Tax=Nocardioides lijunqiniae TaxID=2760832 RepID=UPI001877B37E|nr:hypothetical protein [Nocardioides lijunqiniae]